MTTDTRTALQHALTTLTLLVNDSTTPLDLDHIDDAIADLAVAVEAERREREYRAAYENWYDNVEPVR